MKVDYIIRNGRVMDPLTGVDEVRDVAVCGSRIVDLGGEIAEPRWAEIDAAGCIVTPGLIDFHTHLYHEGSGICIRPDFMLPYGTTAAVDAGSAGCANMRAFFHTAADPSAVKIKAYMTVFSGGQIDGNIIEDFSPSKFNEALIRRVYEKFPHRILGLKIRISKGVVEDAEPLRATVALADKIGGGMGVCVHTTNSPVPAGEIADMLRPGDVFCHCFQGAGNTIVGSDGKIDPAVLAARERGVIFDAANGRGNFGFKAALAALDAGFLPDIISTDLTNDKFNMPYYCKNLPTLMSKYLAMGLCPGQGHGHGGQDRHAQGRRLRRYRHLQGEGYPRRPPRFPERRARERQAPRPAAHHGQRRDPLLQQRVLQRLMTLQSTAGGRGF